jgi:hypothetical protein
LSGKVGWSVDTRWTRVGFDIDRISRVGVGECGAYGVGRLVIRTGVSGNGAGGYDTDGRDTGGVDHYVIGDGVDGNWVSWYVIRA